MLKIDCIEVLVLNVVEDFVIYIDVECKRFLICIVEGNKFIGGFKLVMKVYGIVGKVYLLFNFIFC